MDRPRVEDTGRRMQVAEPVKGAPGKRDSPLLKLKASLLGGADVRGLEGSSGTATAAACRPGLEFGARACRGRRRERKFDPWWLGNGGEWLLVAGAVSVGIKRRLKRGAALGLELDARIQALGVKTTVAGEDLERMGAPSPILLLGWAAWLASELAAGVAGASVQQILDLRLCLYKRLVATEVSVAGAEKEWCRTRRRVSWLGMLLVRLWRCLESCFAAAMGELVRRCLWAAGEYVAANSGDASEEELRSL
ncbi:hypothetical protein MLD38_036917 [Melastoma candidum]|uniref:Uncharacterized protein n=1 Tax=Melastoma candidum TaxID=119954 RepID=A0ACB9LKG6_9MYRT|nr:hypothetical protein MLD38_036917 [Melastoma candidum]